MQLSEDDEGPLKQWIVKRLEDISDADSDVLADYVLALVRSDAPDEDVRTLATKELEDFLKENTTVFVDDIIAVIKSRSYLDGPDSKPPESALSSIGIPTGPARGTYSQGGSKGGLDGQSRKRSFNDHNGVENGNDSHYGRNHERSIKQMRRGGQRGGGFAGRGGYQGGHVHDAQMGGIPGLSSTPISGGFSNMPPVPGLPALDPNDPMSAILAMQALGLPPLPGMPTFPQAGSSTGFPPPGNSHNPGTGVAPIRKIPQRCRDYEQKGFCALGNMCPYEHGVDPFVISGTEEYDPKNSSVVIDGNRHHSASGSFRGRERGRGRGRVRGGSGSVQTARGGRAPFSQAGPNDDRSITTIVVEQIPEDKFDEQTVREFFSTFGAIQEITMQSYKRLALVKYEDWVSAKRAYDSPKVIFDNRFVKVYWYKPESTTTATGMGRTSSSSTPKPPEDKIDMEEFARKQAELQKQHEEKMRKKAEADAAREALEKRKEELMKSQQEEKKKLMERLAAKSGGNTASASPGPSQSGSPVNGVAMDVDKKKNSQTEALRAQLAALEEEAKSLGIDPSQTEESWPPRGGYRGRGRGSYRGFGGYAPRGRGGFDPSFRGSYRGRFAPRGRGAVAYKLDNRTRKVSVSGVEWDSNKDESLRQYLLGIGEFESIDPSPDRPTDSLHITFKDRATAEAFIYGGSEIPSLGKVELSWVNNPTAVAASSTGSNTASEDVKMNDSHTEAHQNGDGDGTTFASTGNVDYDVADDDDRWMIE